MLILKLLGYLIIKLLFCQYSLIWWFYGIILTDFPIFLDIFIVAEQIIFVYFYED